MHADALAHETADRPLAGPAGLRLATIDQAEPFQNSVRVTGTDWRFVYEPTATQYDALTHETPLSPTLVPPFGGGCAGTAQRDPFQTSVSAQFISLLSVYEPTATQCDALAHETALSTLDTAPVRSGLGTTDHDEPFQNSVSARTTSLAL